MAVFVATATGAQAAEEGLAGGLSFGGLLLDTVSVTATRNPTAAFEYPGMVTVVGRSEMQMRQPSSPDDVLRFVPNVEFTGGPRRTGEVPSIRGFSGPDVIILFDGARQNYNSGHDGRFFIDPALLKQVEVLRGPASALYGSGGTGGVIEFRTVDAADLLGPGERYGATLGGGYQTANHEWMGSLTLFGRPTDGVDLLASVVKRDSGRIHLGDGSTLGNNDDDIVSGLAKADFALGEHHRLEASFLTFNNDATEPNNGQGLGGADRVEKNIGSDTYRLAYNYNDPGNPWIDLDLVTYYTAMQADEQRLDALGSGPTGETLKRDVDTVGVRLDNRSRFMLAEGLGTTLTYGVEFHTDEQNGQAAAGPRGGVPDAESSFLGVFGQAEIAWAEPFGVVPGDLLIIPGARFDDYRSESSIAAGNDESQLSPRIGVSYLPTDWLMFFANYAHAFRAPSYDELYLTGTHFTIPIPPTPIVNRFVPNPSLRPQKTETVEFGGGVSFDDVVDAGDRVRLKASHYRTWGRDFIDLMVVQPTPFVDCFPFIPGACDGTTTSVNVPDATLWGTEVEASYESRRLLLALGFSTLDGENDATGAKLGVLTPTQYTANFGVKIPEIDALIGWRVELAEKFTKVNAPADRRDSYDVHDIYFVWQPSGGLLQGVRVDLGVDNVFDRNYSRVFTGAPEQGVNFKAFVRYTLAM